MAHSKKASRQDGIACRLESIDQARLSDEAKSQYAATYASALRRLKNGESAKAIWKALYRRQGDAIEAGLSSVRADALNDAFEGRPPAHQLQPMGHDGDRRPAPSRSLSIPSSSSPH